MAMRFAVGLKEKGKADHIVVDAEDALIAALKAKMSRPEAEIMYVPGQINGEMRGIRLMVSRSEGAVEGKQKN